MANGYKEILAYVIGVALGDGNLSNPNKRATRLRITCDRKYPELIASIVARLSFVFPKNKVGLIPRKGCIDVSIYSNQLEKLLGWKWNDGPKDKQNVGIPDWIKINKTFARECLCGLFQTDGSLYSDRGYRMMNFVNTSARLAHDVFDLMVTLGYEPNMQVLRPGKAKIISTKYTVRLSNKVEKFAREIGYWKK
jgi:hypothetical protein